MDGTMGETRGADLPADVRVLKRILDEGFGAGDPTVVDEVCSPDLLEHQFGLEAAGSEALARVREAICQVHEGYPDMTYTLDDWSQRDDVVWARFTGRGTNTGPFFGPPSGLPVEITVIDIARVRDGRIVEHWGVPDRFALVQQTGVLRRWMSAGSHAPAPA